MDHHKIQERINLIKDQSDRQRMYVHDLIVAMYCLDAEKIDLILDDCIALFGAHQTITKIIFPFLERVQLFSSKYQIKEMHFVVPSIRRKMILAIETLKPFFYSNKNALLFLPEGEHYDLLLLYYNYLLKAMGVRVWYMGTNVLMDDLISILKQKLPDLLLTYVRPNQISKVKINLEKVTQSLPHSVLYVAGFHEKEIQSSGGKNLKFFHYREMPVQLKNVV